MTALAQARANDGHALVRLADSYTGRRRDGSARPAPEHHSFKEHDEIVQAIFDRDYPLVQTSVLFVTIGLILVNLLTDLAYGWLNPRLRVS